MFGLFVSIQVVAGQEAFIAHITQHGWRVMHVFEMVCNLAYAVEDLITFRTVFSIKVPHHENP